MHGCWTISRFKLPTLGWSGAQLALGQVASPGRHTMKIWWRVSTCHRPLLLLSKPEPVEDIRRSSPNRFSALLGSVLSLFSCLGDLGCGWYHLFQSLLHFDFLILQLVVHLLAGLRRRKKQGKARAHSKRCIRCVCQAISIASPGWAHCYRAWVGWCRQTWSALKSLRKGHSAFIGGWFAPWSQEEILETPVGHESKFSCLRGHAGNIRMKCVIRRWQNKEGRGFPDFSFWLSRQVNQSNKWRNLSEHYCPRWKCCDMTMPMAIVECEDGMPPGVETMKHGSGFPKNMFKMPLKKE